jgi:hypothetical protein
MSQGLGQLEEEIALAVALREAEHRLRVVGRSVCKKSTVVRRH